MDEIRLCVFDMGGVVIRDYHIFPSLARYLSLPVDTLSALDPRLGEKLGEHGEGLISEEEFWDAYCSMTGRSVDRGEPTLFGKFFHPRLDSPTVSLIERLKRSGMRVVCGTNVIDAHFRVHQELHQYDIFDAVYASHLMHVRKPKAEFYKAICRSENVAANEVFFTDDTPANVRAATDLGIHGFVYHDAEEVERELKKLGALE